MASSLLRYFTYTSTTQHNVKLRVLGFLALGAQLVKAGAQPLVLCSQFAIFAAANLIQLDKLFMFILETLDQTSKSIEPIRMTLHHDWQPLHKILV